MYIGDKEVVVEKQLGTAGLSLVKYVDDEGKKPFWVSSKIITNEPVFEPDFNLLKYVPI